MARNPKISSQDQENLAREGKRQGTRPENDVFQDKIADDGQEILDEIRTEETEDEDRTERRRVRKPTD